MSRIPVLAVVLGLCAAGCGSSSTSTTPTPTGPNNTPVFTATMLPANEVPAIVGSESNGSGTVTIPFHLTRPHPPGRSRRKRRGADQHPYRPGRSHDAQRLGYSRPQQQLLDAGRRAGDYQQPIRVLFQHSHAGEPGRRCARPARGEVGRPATRGVFRLLGHAPSLQPPDRPCHRNVIESGQKPPDSCTLPAGLAV
jgi:hypothetical protein